MIHPGYTLSEIQKVTGVTIRTLQNWIARGILVLQKEQHPGAQHKRRYTIRDACAISYIVEMAKLKIRPSVSARYFEDVYGVVSKLMIGEMIMKHWDLPDEIPKEYLPEASGVDPKTGMVDVGWEAKNSKVFIFYPIGENGEWDKIEAHMLNGQFYRQTGPNYQKQFEISEKYSICPLEECEDEEMREYKDHLIRTGTYDEKKYQEFLRSHAKINDPEYTKAGEVTEEPVDLSGLPDCFCVLQVDRLVRRVFRSLEALDMK